MDIQESVKRITGETGQKFAHLFYARFFRSHPEVEEYFKEVTISHQAVMLTIALQLIATHYHHFNVGMVDYLKLLGHRHFNWGIKTDDYPKFHNSLMTALAEFHGSDWNDSLSEQWNTAIARATDTMLLGHNSQSIEY